MMRGMRRILIERKYKMDIEKLWSLWTTKEGIESWWGPEGFRVDVSELSVKPGGQLRYSLVAVGEDQIRFMEQQDLPTSTDAVITYTVVDDRRKLGYRSTADFIPGVAAYDVETSVDFVVEENEVLMLLSFDPMHNEEWTHRAVSGRESELARLQSLLS